MGTLDEAKSRLAELHADGAKSALWRTSDVAGLVAGFDAVLNLHSRMPSGSCAECYTPYGEPEVYHPCETIEALLGGLQ